MSAAHDPPASGQNSGARIVRWSDSPGGLSVEECARRGIEALAGLVISGDIFGTNNFPDAHFCACAEIRHVVTGAGGNFDDHIDVGFRSVEIRDGIYPMVGPESVKMIMQPLADGNVSASWDPIGGTDGSPGDPDVLMAGLERRSGICRPMALGEMPRQETGDTAPPSFLLLKDPGVGWQIWRRFTSEASDDKSAPDNVSRNEAFTMVYPVRSPHMNWRFRVYDLPGGKIRWEVDSGKRT